MKNAKTFYKWFSWNGRVYKKDDFVEILTSWHDNKTGVAKIVNIYSDKQQGAKLVVEWFWKGTDDQMLEREYPQIAHYLIFEEAVGWYLAHDIDIHLIMGKVFIADKLDECHRKRQQIANSNNSEYVNCYLLENVLFNSEERRLEQVDFGKIKTEQKENVYSIPSWNKIDEIQMVEERKKMKYKCVEMMNDNYLSGNSANVENSFSDLTSSSSDDNINDQDLFLARDNSKTPPMDMINVKTSHRRMTSNHIDIDDEMEEDEEEEFVFDDEEEFVFEDEEEFVVQPMDNDQPIDNDQTGQTSSGSEDIMDEEFVFVNTAELSNDDKSSDKKKKTGKDEWNEYRIPKLKEIPTIQHQEQQNINTKKEDNNLRNEEKKEQEINEKYTKRYDDISSLLDKIKKAKITNTTIKSEQRHSKKEYIPNEPGKNGGTVTFQRMSIQELRQAIRRREKDME